jgi:hypothetical protein
MLTWSLGWTGCLLPSRGGRRARCAEREVCGGAGHSPRPSHAVECAKLDRRHRHVQYQSLGDVQMRVSEPPAEFPQQRERRHRRQRPGHRHQLRPCVARPKTQRCRRQGDDGQRRQKAAVRQRSARVFSRRALRAVPLNCVGAHDERILDGNQRYQQRDPDRVKSELGRRRPAADQDRRHKAGAADHRLIRKRQSMRSRNGPQELGPRLSLPCSRCARVSSYSKSFQRKRLHRRSSCQGCLWATGHLQPQIITAQHDRF